VEEPAQTEAVDVPVSCGTALTVTTTGIDLEQPLAVPVTEYVTFVVGVAVTEAPVATVKPVEGVHEYDVAPDAVNVVPLPLQTDALPDVVTFGNAVTATAIVFVALQPPLVPVTV